MPASSRRGLLGRWTLGIALLIQGGIVTSHGASNTFLTFEGRPFSSVNTLVSNTYPWMLRELVGGIPTGLTDSGAQVLVITDRGGATDLTAVTPPLQPGQDISRFRLAASGFRTISGGTNDRAFVLAAGTPFPGLYLSDGASSRVWAEPGLVLPDTGGLKATEVGEPHRAGDQVVLTAFARDFTTSKRQGGVYRIREGGTLVRVADLQGGLPGGDSSWVTNFSSGLGFDGQAVAFIAEGDGQSRVYVQRQEGAAVEEVFRTGSVLPEFFASSYVAPPILSGGRVAVLARHTGVGWILRESAAGPEVVVRPGDRTADGREITSLGIPGFRIVGGAGLVAEGGRIYFGAALSGQPAVYYAENGALQPVIPPGVLFPLGPVTPGYPPETLTVEDVEDGVVLVQVTYPFGGIIPRRDAHYVANLREPAAPVLVSSPASAVHSRGDRVVLEAVARGDAPLAYLLVGPRGPLPATAEGRWEIPSMSFAEAGDYTLTLSNRWGQATAPRFTLNISEAPRVVEQPKSVSGAPGAAVVLQVRAEGAVPLSYTWRRLGRSLPSMWSSKGEGVARVNYLTPADTGWYDVVVSNSFGVVTSALVRLSMPSGGWRPPMADGQPLVSAIVSGVPTWPFGLKVIFNTLRARWTDPGLVFDAYGPGLGIYLATGQDVRPIVVPGEPLPDGLGIGRGFELIPTSSGEGPLGVQGYRVVDDRFQKAGFFWVDGLRLRSWVDLTHAAPPRPGDGGQPRAWSRFLAASQHGDDLVFVGETGADTIDQVVVGLATRTEVRHLVGLDELLPLLATNRFAVEPFFDGHQVALRLGNLRFSLFPDQRLFVGTIDGGWRPVFQSGDRIPGFPGNLRWFNVLGIHEGRVFIYLQTTEGAGGVMSWKEGVFRSEVMLGTVVDGAGRLAMIDPVVLEQDGERLFFRGYYQGEFGDDWQISVVDERGVRLANTGSIFDGWRSSSMNSMAFQGTRWALVPSTLGWTSLYLSDNGPRAPAPSLEILPADHGHLRLRGGPSANLEWSSEAKGPWSVVGDIGGEWLVPPEAAQGFFRLRQP